MSNEKNVETKKRAEIHLVKLLISVAVGIVLALLPAPEGLTPEIMKFLGVFAAMIAALLTNAVPNWLVTTTCCMVMILLKLTKINVIMGNFSSNNIWMPLSIVGFAGCLAKSGLLSRIAFNVFKVFPGSYGGTVLATGAASLVLTPLVPSTSAKLGVLTPFTAALAE